MWLMNHVIKPSEYSSECGHEAKVLQANEERRGQRKGGDQHVRKVWSFLSKSRDN